MIIFKEKTCSLCRCLIVVIVGVFFVVNNYSSSIVIHNNNNNNNNNINNNNRIFNISSSKLSSLLTSKFLLVSKKSTTTTTTTTTIFNRLNNNNNNLNNNHLKRIKNKMSFISLNNNLNNNNLNNNNNVVNINNNFVNNFNNNNNNNNNKHEFFHHLTKMNGIPKMFRWVCNEFPSCLHEVGGRSGIISNNNNNNNNNNQKKKGYISSKNNDNNNNNNNKRNIQKIIQENILDDNDPNDHINNRNKNKNKKNNDNDDDDEMGIVDNLYLDMNGIIHLCSHGNAEDIVYVDEERMFRRILQHTDKIIQMVNPRKLIYIAIDGVAPRAKMNQQRMRRFKAIQEKREQMEEWVLFNNQNQFHFDKRKGKKRGKVGNNNNDNDNDDFNKNKNKIEFDSNCITPGTEFMHKLDIAFEKWIRFKMMTDPFWKTTNTNNNNSNSKKKKNLNNHNNNRGPKVIFSGSKTPGEGEHKLMSYIRKQQNLSANKNKDKNKNLIEEEEEVIWDKNAKHVFYGMDADLIMLGLVTHEKYVKIIREKFRGSNKGYKDPLTYNRHDFQFFDVSHFRDSFVNKLKDTTKHIYRQQLQLTMKKHKQNKKMKLKKTNSNHNHYHNLSSSESESESESPLPYQQQQQQFVYNDTRIMDDFILLCVLVGNDFLPNIPHLDIGHGALDQLMITYGEFVIKHGGYLSDGIKIHHARLESFIRKISTMEPYYFKKRAIEDGEDGYSTNAYKYYYYKLKMNIDIMMKKTNKNKNKNNDQKMSNYENNNNTAADDSDNIRRNMVQKYIEGIHWVLHYYHKDCSSWSWYYPYHYAPLGSDFSDLPSININFNQSVPYSQFMQLLSILPPQNKHFIPFSYQYLMSDSGPLQSFFPWDIKSDLNGKFNDWEAVVLAPFLTESDLFEALTQIDHKKELADSEKERNRMQQELEYISSFRGSLKINRIL